MKPKMTVPQFAVLSLGFLLLGLFAIRQSALPIAHPETPVEWHMALRFEDGPQGEVVVLDARNNQEITRFEGEQGFLRGTLRAMARQRKLNGVGAGAAEPFELILHADGRLTLHDPATGTKIALESFGSRNIGVFAQLIG